MDFISHKKIFLSVSAVLVAASIAAIALWGLKLGIDFTGGSLLEIEFQGERPANVEIKKALEGLPIGSPVIQPTGERGMILRFSEVDEETHQAILRRLKEYFSSKVQEKSPRTPLLEIGEGGDLDQVSDPVSFRSKNGITELRFDSIGPTIGKELRKRALIALGTALLAIIFYIAWAFRHVSKPVSSWKYGVVAVVALLHDIIIPTGVFAVLGRFRGVELDAFFIAALLTILGFSVHDTIVVFDRIRENMQKLKASEPYESVVNRGVNQTLSRSINTSLTTLFVLAAIFFFGGTTTRYLSLALSLGIIFGTYSSIFVAPLLLVVWNNLTNKS